VIGVALVGVVAAATIGSASLGRSHVAAAGSRSAIETAITLSAMFSAVLLSIQFRRTRRTKDLFLLAALTTVSLADFAFNALPAVAGYQIGVHGMGARMAAYLIATAAFTAAAFTPRDRRVERYGRRMAGFAGLGTLVVLGAGELLEHAFASGQGTSLQDYHPALNEAALVSAVGLTLAGWMFTTHRRAGDEYGSLLGAAAFLLAGAALQRLVLPLTKSDWVTPADLMRLAAYAILLLTALRLSAGTRRQIAAEALVAERTKIAHDLHDGLAQDLALIAAHSDRLEREFGAEHPLTVAARRALAASRGKIVDLAATEAPSTAAALREVATELELRYGIDVSVSVQGAADPQPSARYRHELIRIVREAIANAARHGGARHVSVTLGSRRSKLLLRVEDDGCGIDSPAAQANPGTGIGMSGMRSRAHRLGGSLIARRGDAGGTQIEVLADRRPH
jgi:signal transduction histidine kinase